MNNEIKELVNNILNKRENQDALNKLTYKERCIVAKTFPELFGNKESKFRALVNNYKGRL